VLWHCWSSVRKSIQRIKNWLMTCWHGYLSGVRRKWFAYGPVDASVTPIISFFIKIHNTLTFMVSAYPGCPGKEAVKWVSACRLKLWTYSEFAFCKKSNLMPGIFVACNWQKNNANETWVTTRWERIFQVSIVGRITEQMTHDSSCVMQIWCCWVYQL